MPLPAGLDPRTPVVVGVGQLRQRPDDPLDALEPLAMMAGVLEAAADDAGARGLLAALTDVWVVDGAWPYGDPGRLLADRWGADARTGRSTPGGNSPQMLVNQACSRIAGGAADVVAVVGAEAIWSRRRARRAGGRIPYTEQPDAVPDEIIGKELVMNHEIEAERGFEAPVVLYPMFESAHRAERGETIDEHRDRVSELWERFNAVAVENPHAWLRRPMTAAEIREPDDGNRMVGFPYTKAMNSNWDLDLAAGLIVCSAEAADALGVEPERWVFVWSGTDGADTQYVSNRASMAHSPAIRIAGRRALELAGVTADDVDHVDLYSCFPSAVQIAAAELGFGEDRVLTQTGGLTFAGGPLNNYVTHGIAAMVETLRADRGSVGLCTANGGYLTKHAFGVYSTSPPPGPYRHEDCQPAIDELPTRELRADHVGSAEIEAYTVLHGADGPERALAAVRTPDGGRQWATSEDPALMADLMATEHVGRTVDIGPDFTFTVRARR